MQQRIAYERSNVGWAGCLHIQHNLFILNKRNSRTSANCGHGLRGRYVTSVILSLLLRCLLQEKLEQIVTLDSPNSIAFAMH